MPWRRWTVIPASHRHWGARNTGSCPWQSKIHRFFLHTHLVTLAWELGVLRPGLFPPSHLSLFKVVPGKFDCILEGGKIKGSYDDGIFLVHTDQSPGRVSAFCFPVIWKGFQEEGAQGTESICRGGPRQPLPWEASESQASTHCNSQRWSQAALAKASGSQASAHCNESFNFPVKKRDSRDQGP